MIESPVAPKRKLTLGYLVLDWVAMVFAWGLFFIYRKAYIEAPKFGIEHISLLDGKFWFGIALIPLCWIIWFACVGEYYQILRKTRVKVISWTLIELLIGSLALFFVLVLDDEIVSYKTYYKLFSALFLIHFFISLILRWIYVSFIVKQVQSKVWGFPTLILGCDKRALDIWNQLEASEKSEGNLIQGYICLDRSSKSQMPQNIRSLGTFKDLRNLVDNYAIEELIVALENSEHHLLQTILSEVEDKNVTIKVIPDLYDILSGSVKMNSIFGKPYVIIQPEIMPVWQQNFKRAIDVFSSLLALIILLPVFIIIAIGVKLGSAGPIFYSHERIGLNGKPFKIIKFRSMTTGAEALGPQLSSKNDKRVTTFGKFLRKYRLDEIPQFYNVIIGEMSLVGPRPERQFFIDQIMDKAPHYRLLHKVRPGITSWGQVKFGYAENVDQMIERLTYDVIYIENMTLAVDFKIMFFTIKTVIQGRGK